MKKIAIVGINGKMGSLLAKKLQGDFLSIGIDKTQNLRDFEKIDLVIDFATHESSLASAEYCLKNKIPIIIGSTGQTQEENERLLEISKHIKVVKKANFSNGIEVLKMFVENALKLNPESFEIIEKHHIHKKDKPSGTAIELKSFIEDRFSGCVKISSIREGEEMGEHIIIASFGDEKLTIKHNVYSRESFAKGVVSLAKKMLT